MPEKDSRLGTIIIELMAGFAERECFGVMEAGSTLGEFEALKIAPGDLLLFRPHLDDPEITLRIAQAIQRWISKTNLPLRGVEFLVVPKEVDIKTMPRAQAVAMLRRMTGK